MGKRWPCWVGHPFRCSGESRGRQIFALHLRLLGVLHPAGPRVGAAVSTASPMAAPVRAAAQGLEESGDASHQPHRHKSLSPSLPSLTVITRDQGCGRSPRNKELGSCSSDAPRKRREKQLVTKPPGMGLEERVRRERGKRRDPAHKCQDWGALCAPGCPVETLPNSLHTQVSPIPSGSSCLSGAFHLQPATTRSGPLSPHNSSYDNSLPATPCFSRPDPHASAHTISSNTVLVMNGSSPLKHLL